MPISGLYSEPVGGSAPKFPSETDLTRTTHPVEAKLRLKCPAQGAPVPLFRFGMFCFQNQLGALDLSFCSILMVFVNILLLKQVSRLVVQHRLFQFQSIGIEMQIREPLQLL